MKIKKLNYKVCFLIRHGDFLNKYMEFHRKRKQK